VASYRRRYQEPEADHDELVARLSAFSAAACLAANAAAQREQVVPSAGARPSTR
jgi:hypothetical protein